MPKWSTSTPHPTKPYTRYYGRPCGRCGGTERYLASHGCVECYRVVSRDLARKRAALKAAGTLVPEVVVGGG